MSNQQSEPDFLASKISQLQENQKILAKHIVEIKHRLDSLTEQFDNRPEKWQISALENALGKVHQQLDGRSIPQEAQVELVNLQTEQVQSYKYQLVFERSNSRSVLLEALEKAQERLIIVCPGLNRSSIDGDIIQKFIDCLNRNCSIEISWGYLGDRSRIGVGWRYNALKDLRQLEWDYSDLFKLKLLGTHEKFLVCDRVFAMLGSHNLLTSSASCAEREAGIFTTDTQIIQGLINRFDGAQIKDAQAIDTSLTTDSAILDDVSDANEDINDFAEDSQEKAMIAEEFLQRYEAGESDFTGINLAGVNLSGVSLARENVNLSRANLIRANLSDANLSGVNLSEAKLIEANLRCTNLTGVNLAIAELNAAYYMGGAKLVETNLSSAKLIQANLYRADLNNAKLTGAIMPDGTTHE